MDNNTTGRALGWDDAIENDGEYQPLPDGEYSFRVLTFERARFGGSLKLPACNQAKLTIEVGDADRSVEVNHNLFLHTKTEGMLCAFFRSIGARTSGERLVMDWSKVPGSTGRCKVVIHEFAGKDGNKRVSNNISRFLDPEDAAATTDTTKQAQPEPEGMLPF